MSCAGGACCPVRSGRGSPVAGRGEPALRGGVLGMLVDEGHLRAPSGLVQEPEPRRRRVPTSIRGSWRPASSLETGGSPRRRARGRRRAGLRAGRRGRAGPDAGARPARGAPAEPDPQAAHPSRRPGPRRRRRVPLPPRPHPRRGLRGAHEGAARRPARALRAWLERPSATVAPSTSRSSPTTWRPRPSTTPSSDRWSPGPTCSTRALAALLDAADRAEQVHAYPEEVRLLRRAIAARRPGSSRRRHAMSSTSSSGPPRRRGTAGIHESRGGARRRSPRPRGRGRDRAVGPGSMPTRPRTRATSATANPRMLTSQRRGGWWRAAAIPRRAPSSSRGLRGC